MMKTPSNRPGFSLLRSMYYALLLSLVTADLAWSSEVLKIAPARALPDYRKTGLAVTMNTGPHLHPVFDIGDINKDGRLDVVMFEMDGPDGSPDPVRSLATVYLQNADESFSRQTEVYVLPIANAARDFLLADFNEDGN